MKKNMRLNKCSMPGTSEKWESTGLANVVVSMRMGNFSISQMKNWLVLWLQVLGSKTSGNWNYHPSYTSNYVPTFVFWTPFCDIMTFAGTNTWVIRLYRMPDPWLELDVVCCQLRPGDEGQSCVTPNIIRRTAHKELETVVFLPFSGSLVLVTELCNFENLWGLLFLRSRHFKSLGKELSVCLILELIRGGFIFVVESKAGRKLHSCLWQCQKLRKISCMCSLWMNS